jgi:hypothetical protein
MTNGANHTGAIHIGDLDMWSFQANAGDAIMLAIGETGGNSELVPWIRLKSPTGQNLGSQSGALAAQIEAVASVTGTYTVVVSTFDSSFDATGAYTLTLAKGPGAFAISNGDEGGVMTNGGNYPGHIHIGDLDMWTFQATAGESIAIAVGEVGADQPFVPWIRLKSPTGQNLGSQSGAKAAQIAATASVTGTYTVVVSSFDSSFDAFGDYSLTISNGPRPFIVPVGDQGGGLTPGNDAAGTIVIGDLDTWSFSAHQGDPLLVNITEVGSSAEFVPWIRLRSPTGVILGSQSGASTAAIGVTAPASGIYTVVVSSFDSGFDGFGDYTLNVTGVSSSMIKNGKFDQGEQFWQFFATPTLAYVVHHVVNGVLEYYRVPPPPGTSNQAVAFQETGVSLPAFAPIIAKFDLANTSPARKRIAVLIIDSNFEDLSVCTFWMAPNAPMRTYVMRTHTTQTWNNAALYFYAASEGGDGGVYQIDNVSMAYDPELSDDRTDCVDPTTPAPRSVGDGPNLIANGDFGTGQLAPWTTFSFINWQISNGVFEFVKPNNNTPSGVVLQPTWSGDGGRRDVDGDASSLGTAAGAQAGHGDSGRPDFSDISACTFWLQPGQPLSTYVYRTFVHRPVAERVAVGLPRHGGPAGMDASRQRHAAANAGSGIVGTECIEPSHESESLAPTRSRRRSSSQRLNRHRCPQRAARP